MLATQRYIDGLALREQWVATHLMGRETLGWFCRRIRGESPAQKIAADHRADRRFAAANRLMRARGARIDREVRAIKRTFQRAGYSTDWIRW